MRARARAGFALPVALMLMLVGTVLVMSGLHVAHSDLAANRAVRLSHAALRAAEAGGYRTLVRWETTGADSLAPGDSTDTGWAGLPGGGVYRTVIRRVDDGTGAHRFRLRTAGRPGPEHRAQRLIYTMVEAGGITGQGDGAVTAGGRLRVRGIPGRPEIEGADRNPVGWASLCASADQDVAGVRIPDRADLRLQAGGGVEGQPDVAEDPGLGSDDFTTVGGGSYDDLAAAADIRFAGNTVVSSPLAPRISGGVCDRSDSLNWGNPLGTGGPCGDYLPVIHTAGSLDVDSNGRGQGILLVDGDLRVTGDLQFTGLVVVLGSVELGGGTTVTGAVRVRNGAGMSLQSTVQAPARVLYSSCAVLRVAGGASAPALLAGRHWFDAE